MPELPEVETTCRGIVEHLKARQIKKIDVYEPRLRYPVTENLSMAAEGQTITGVSRRAKYIIIQLLKGQILIHLGMSGHLKILKHFLAKEKHAHIDLTLDNGKILRYCDPRKFGLWLYHPDSSEHPLLKQLGPEPLSEQFHLAYLLSKAKNKKKPIKSFLMSNDIVVGIGNIYATEILFLAGIHPLSPAQNLSKQQLQIIIEKTKSVLNKAIAAGGTTLKDFFSSEGKPGYFAQSLWVYARQDQACLICSTEIKSTKIAGRNSSYCPECQPLF